MPVTVKNISLWRKEVENQVGALANTLEPVTKAGANLQILMGYRYPGEATKSAIEIYPIATKKMTAAAYLPSPALGVVIKVDEAVAIVNFDFEQAEHREAENAGNFSASIVAD